jgi:hypothetical protein
MRPNPRQPDAADTPKRLLQLLEKGCVALKFHSRSAQNAAAGTHMDPRFRGLGGVSRITGASTARPR